MDGSSLGDLAVDVGDGEEEEEGDGDATEDREDGRGNVALGVRLLHRLRHRVRSNLNRGVLNEKLLVVYRANSTKSVATNL